MQLNFRCGEIFFLENQKNFLFICKFCNENFLKFDKFFSHHNECFPKKENIYLIEIVKTSDNDYKSKSNQNEKISETGQQQVFERNKIQGDHEMNKSDRDLSELEEVLIFPKVEKDVDENYYVENPADSENYGEEEFSSPAEENESISITSTAPKNEETIEYFKCDLCEDSFGTKKILERHKKIIHLSENRVGSSLKLKPFPCSICSKRFTRFDHLKAHKKNLHNITDYTEDEKNVDKKPYKCTVCLASFPRTSELRIHERHHTGYKPFGCPHEYCGKRFVAKPYLTSHLLSHSKERLYCCEICSKTYVQASGLLKHQKIHTGTRSFKCQYCDKSFTSKSIRNNHERRIHYLEYVQIQNEPMVGPTT